MIKYEINKGQFIKHCPCTPDVIPCGYYNMNLHTGCPYDCSYCILQTYLESKDPVYFTNLDDLEKELAEISVSRPYLRIGTGELSDSLALDPQTRYSHKILSIFEKYPEIIFEFKTKSANVRDILEYSGKLKNIVISWSLNPQEIIAKEELLTPDLTTRLNAMKIVQEHGYKIGIHFDPLIYCDGWETAYRELIVHISRIIAPSKIAWWSLGALRFPYSLREHIFKHTHSRLFEGELIKGHDGKYRYFKPIRVELFSVVKGLIRRYISSDAPLYLCMENKDVWETVFPEITAEEASVNRYLYESAVKP